MVEMAAGSISPTAWMNIWGINELRGIKNFKGRLFIGALTTYSDIIHSEDVQSSAPILVDAARAVGALQIQNRGTLGGNIANASPAGDTLPVLMALDAVVEVASAQRGSRFVPIDRFFRSYRSVDMEADELISGVWLPAPKPGDHTYFRKVGTRAAQSISKVVMAALIRTVDDTVAVARVALGSVGPMPLRCRHTEAALLGKPISPTAVEELRKDIQPIDDIRSTARYRETIAENILKTWLESL